LGEKGEERSNLISQMEEKNEIHNCEDTQAAEVADATT
jgi:hypothetical protein